MTITVAVLNQKGGSGKTTLSLNIAGALVQRNQSVLLVDADPQGSLSRWAELGGEIPVVSLNQPRVLKNTLPSLVQGKDWIIIDGPPRVENTMMAAITLADVVLIPIQPSLFDIHASQEVFDLLSAKHEMTPNIPRVALIATRVQTNTKVGQEIQEVLGKFDYKVTNSFTGNRVIYTECLIEGKTVFQMSGNEKAVAEINGIVDELQELLNG